MILILFLNFEIIPQLFIGSLCQQSFLGMHVTNNQIFEYSMNFGSKNEFQITLLLTTIKIDQEFWSCLFWSKFFERTTPI